MTDTGLRRFLKSDRIGSRIALVALLAGFAFLKLLVYNPPPIGNLPFDDGNFYYQSARHVAEGNGLLTSVSAQNVGPKELPFANPVYPLWPLVLGGAGSIVGLHVAAAWLPELLYFLSLLALYGLTRRIAGSRGSPHLLAVGGRPVLDVGHVAVLLFGSTYLFFRFTSFPFTEGLAFVVLFGCVWAVARASEDHPVRWGFAAGVLGGLCYLTRYQFLGLVLTVPAALAIVGFARRRYLHAAGAAVLGALVVIVPWSLHVTGIYGGFEPRLLVDPSAVQMTPELKRYNWLAWPDSLRGLIRYRLLASVPAAFALDGPHSYVRTFGPAVFLVPLALLVYLASIARPARWKTQLREAGQPRHLPLIAAAVCGLAAIGPLHLMYSVRFGGWLFHYRQALPFIILIVVALCYLLVRRSPWIRSTALVLIGLSIVHNATKLTAELRQADDYQPRSTAQHEFAEWIENRPQPPVFVSTAAYTLGALTRGRYHAITCRESAEQMTVYFDLVNVDHVVTLAGQTECSFFTNVRSRLRLSARFGKGEREISVWRVVDRGEDQIEGPGAASID